MAALQQGSKGSDVRKLQEDLNNKVPSVKLKVDGDFGPKTKEAVERFQKMYGLKADGIAGGKTLSTLLPAGATSGSEPRHVVARGETLAAICKKSNDCDPKLIWEHPANKPLRTTRLKPELILAGDTVVFPKELTAPAAEYYEFKYNGKQMVETSKKLAHIADLFLKHHESIEGAVSEMRASADGTNGLLEAFVVFCSAKRASVDIPEFKTQSTSRAAVYAARSVCKRTDLNASRKALNDAKVAIRAFDRDVARYREKLIGGAGTIVGELELTRDLSFAVAEVIATATLTVKTGNPKLAASSSAAIFGAIKSGATEVGEHIADPKRTWDQSAKNIVVDTAVSAGSSIIAGGITDNAVKKLAGKTAAKALADKTVNVLGKQVTQELLEKVLTTGGQKVVKDGANEALKAGGEMVKKGRVLTAAEFEKQVTDYVTGFVVGKFVKRLKGGTWKYSRNLESTLVDSKAAKLGAWYQGLGNAQRAKVIHDIFTKNEEEIIKFGLKDAGSWMTPEMSEDAIAKKAEKVALSQKQLMDMLAKEIEKVHKKNGK